MDNKKITQMSTPLPPLKGGKALIITLIPLGQEI
jgi:hypothetical protein